MEKMDRVPSFEDEVNSDNWGWGVWQEVKGRKGKRGRGRNVRAPKEGETEKMQRGHLNQAPFNRGARKKILAKSRSSSPCVRFAVPITGSLEEAFCSACSGRVGSGSSLQSAPSYLWYTKIRDLLDL